MDALPAALAAPLARRAHGAAAWLRQAGRDGRRVTVVHHIDADGVSAGAIALEALARAGIPHRSVAAKSLDSLHLGQLLDGGHEALWLCDFGSAAYMRLPGVPKLVCDHHQLVRDGGEESFPHVNPLLDGLSGEEISGAGCAYLVAAALDALNADLLPLAIVGAAGDLQDRHGGFQGANLALLEHGERLGLLESEVDLGWFGPETRPLRKFLANGSDPEVPTVTGSTRSAEALLAALGLADAAAADAPWSALAPAARRRVRSALVDRLLACGAAADADRLFRRVVRLRREAPGRPTREVREFATLLNGTARYGRPEAGLAVARGDRGAAFQEALGLLRDHRRNLAGSLDAFARSPVREGTAIQEVHLGDQVLDTVVGIVAGMALESLDLRRDLALVAFAHAPDGRTKASARSPYELQARGIDLAAAMRGAAAAVGGDGGGHKGAAGATIPRGREAEFASALDAAVAAQLGLAAPAAVAR